MNIEERIDPLSAHCHSLPWVPEDIFSVSIRKKYPLQPRVVTVTCCQSKLKSIPNFLLFYQFLFDLLADLIFRSALNFVERRIRSTICDSLF